MYALEDSLGVYKGLKEELIPGAGTNQEFSHFPQELLSKNSTRGLGIY